MHKAGRSIQVFAVAMVLLTVPIFILAGLRFWQLRTHDRGWAQLARASQWLGRSEVCDGASSALMARGDLERWGHAVHLVEPLRAQLSAESLAATEAMEAEIGEGLHYDDTALVPFVLARCHQSAGLARALLQEAVRAGLDPATQPNRIEERALRDLVTYGCLWLLCVGLLAMKLRHRADAPGAALWRLLQRLNDGDLDLPQDVDDMGELPRLLAAGLRRVRQDRELLRDKLSEGHRLVLRVIDLIDAPVLILSVEGHVDYVNAPAAKAFGCDAARLQDRDLDSIVGGAELRRALESALECGRSRNQSEVVTEEQGYVARSALVHSSDGDPVRVVMVLSKLPGPQGHAAAGIDEEPEWWRRLWDSVH